MTPLPAAAPAPVPLPSTGLVEAGSGTGVALSHPLTWMAEAFGPVDAEQFAEYLETWLPLEPIAYDIPRSREEILAWGRSRRWAGHRRVPRHYTRAQMDRKNLLKRLRRAAKKAREAA